MDAFYEFDYFWKPRGVVIFRLITSYCAYTNYIPEELGAQLLRTPETLSLLEVTPEV